MESTKPTFNLEQIKQFVHILHEAIIVVDDKLRIIVYNPDAQNLFGYKESEIINQPLDMLIPPEFHHRHADLASQFIKNKSPPKMLSNRQNLWGMRKDKSQFPVEISLTNLDLNDHRLVLAVIHDETSDYEREKRYQYRAEHDLLTGLSNRAHLIETLDLNLAQPDPKQHLALFFIDLDKFKPINDTYGHAIGDKLLTIVAKRISAAVRSHDLVCRFGGDEFVLLVPQCLKPEQLENIAKKILTSLSRAIKIGSHKLEISASIGIARYPENAQTSTQLLHAADQAMYKAKTSHNTYYLLPADSTTIKQS